MKSTLVFFLAFFPFVLISNSLCADTFVSDGVIYRSVPEISSKLGMKLTSAESRKKITLKSKWSKIEFTRGSRIIKINDVRIYLGFPSVERNKSLYIPELDWQFTLSPILVAPQLTSKQKSIQTIIIDAGHGGKDPGAQNPKLKINEKDLTLQLSKLLEKRLKKRGFKVYLTRKKDKFIELGDRPAYARKKNADLFISIHFNASDNESANGIESYAYTLLNQPSTSRKTVSNGDKVFRRANRNDKLNILLAYYAQNNLLNDNEETDRGVKRARFTVLENLHCPGVLLELGFIRNPKTANNLKNSKYLDNLAESLEKAIIQYQKRIQSS